MNVVLVIIYNHKYDKNIDIVEDLYRNRFSTIYHLVPFYTGNKSNVIPVYENSIYFQGYVAQGFNRFFNENATHYFFVADDMIINPNINESNYFNFFHLDEEKSFIPEFFNLYETNEHWPHTAEVFAFQLTKRKVEAQRELPDYEEAEARLLKNEAINRSIRQEKPLKWKDLNKKPGRNIFRKENCNKTVEWLSETIRRKRHVLSYPLTGSYSDIFMVSAKSIKPFCHYCGVFAALELFAESAIPTALALSANGIVTEKDLFMKGKPLWTVQDFTFLAPFKMNIDVLINNYPKEILYIHPIKLSQWDTKNI
jgi:hypothetical protein